MDTPRFSRRCLAPAPYPALHAESSSGSHRSVSADCLAAAVGRSLGRHSGVPSSGRISLGTGPLPAASRQCLPQSLAPAPTPIKPFKAYEPGFLHINVKYLPAIGGEPSRYLFVAIDRATRWVSIALKADHTAYSARAFLKAVIQAAPFRIQKRLTDNGSEFTDRFLGRTRQLSGAREFDQLRAEQAIEHRLIPPHRPFLLATAVSRRPGANPSCDLRCDQICLWTGTNSPGATSRPGAPPAAAWIGTH
jgi:hypothetical protein